MKIFSSARYASVTSTLALVVALGGASYAAATLPKNSVGSQQIKSNAVKSAEVKDGSLEAADFGKGQIPPGPQGAQGPKGDPGTALGYALIAGNGTVTLAKGLANANVTRLDAGAYCISGLAFTPQNVIATIAGPSTSDTVATGVGVGPSSCPAGTQARAFVRNSVGAFADMPFFILLN